MAARAPGPRILLVEDDAVIALYESRALSRLGLAVDWVKNAAEALRRAGEGGGGFDVVLMDVDLGAGMDGVEAAFELRKSCEVPIVFLSSGEKREVEARAAGLSAWSFFPKERGINALCESIGIEAFPDCGPSG